jgi:hypothetical protein
LLICVSKSGNLASISPVVDLANAVSLKYVVPLGVHDIDSLEELVFPIDGFSTNLEVLFEARNFPASSLETFFNCKTRVGVIYINSPDYKISNLSAEDIKAEEISFASIRAAFESAGNSNESNNSIDRKE